MAEFLVKSSGAAAEARTVLMGADCWPSINCILAQKIVSVSTELTHNRSALVLGSNSIIASSMMKIRKCLTLFYMCAKPCLVGLAAEINKTVKLSTMVCAVNTLLQSRYQGSPNYDPRDKSCLRSHFHPAAKHILPVMKKYYSCQKLAD